MGGVEGKHSITADLNKNGDKRHSHTVKFHQGSHSRTYDRRQMPHCFCHCFYDDRRQCHTVLPLRYNDRRQMPHCSASALVSICLRCCSRSRGEKLIVRVAPCKPLSIGSFDGRQMPHCPASALVGFRSVSIGS